MVLTPQMAISHLVMTIGVGISQKKNIKNFDHVQILWNDPYNISLYIEFGVLEFTRYSEILDQVELVQGMK